MSLDPKAAQTLRKLFSAHAGQYPYLLPEAEILFENSGGSKMRFHANDPFETAKILMHLQAHDGNGVFDRKLQNGSLAPISFRMHKRVRLEPDAKEHVMPAFNIAYQALEEEGHLWISDPENNKYFWLGDEKIDDRPPMTFHAPKLSDLIETLWRAGNSWQRVNFMTHVPRLKVHVNPNHASMPGQG